jgi:CRISPR-associated protein Csb1
LETSPVSLVFGAWDSTRRSHQARFRSALVGEIVGVLADQEGKREVTPLRGGARVDPVAMSVQLPAKDFDAILTQQESEWSPKKVQELRGDLKKVKDNATISAAALGLGGLPPTLDALGGVACRRIIRTHVLSFSALRQLRFGSDAEGDAACRALLAALALNGLARSDSELSLRANCDLVEAGPTRVVLDQRYGERKKLTALSIQQADELLATALAEATAKAGIRWEGQVLAVTGNPAVLAGAVEDEA